MSERFNYPEVYIAGPLFNPEENFHNDTLAAMFREAGYTVFNPHIDGLQYQDYGDLPEREAGKKLHDYDYIRVINSRITTVNLDGPQVDDGSSAESGFGFTSRDVLTRLQEEIKKFLDENKLSEDTSNIYNQFLRSPIFKPRVKLIIGYLSDIRWITPKFRRNPVVSENMDIIFDNRKDIVKYCLENCPPENIK